MGDDGGSNSTSSLWSAPETLEIVSFLNTFVKSENYSNQVPFTLDDLETAVTGLSGESAAQQLLGTLLDGLTNVDRRRKENKGRKKSARYGPRCGLLREEWEGDLFSLLRSRATEFEVAGELNPFVDYDEDFAADEDEDEDEDENGDATETSAEFEFECEYGCGFDGTQEAVEEHERTSCPLRPSTLAACSVVAHGQGSGKVLGNGSAADAVADGPWSSDGGSHSHDHSHSDGEKDGDDDGDSDGDYQQRRGAPTAWSQLEPWERLLAIHSIMLWSLESNVTALGKELRQRVRDEGANALRPTTPRAGHISAPTLRSGVEDEGGGEAEDMAGVYFVLTDEAGGLRVVRSPCEEVAAEEAWRSQPSGCESGGREGKENELSRDKGRSKGRRQDEGKANSKRSSRKDNSNSSNGSNGSSASSSSPADNIGALSDDVLLRAASAPPLQERRQLRCAGWQLLATTIEETAALADKIEKGGEGGTVGAKRRKKRKRSQVEGGEAEADREQRKALAGALRARVAEAVEEREAAAAAARKLVKVQRALGSLNGGGNGGGGLTKRSRRARKKVDYSMSAFDDQILDAVKQLNGSEERAADRAERAYRARRRAEEEVLEREKTRKERVSRREKLGLRG